MTHGPIWSQSWPSSKKKSVVVKSKPSGRPLASLGIYNVCSPDTRRPYQGKLEAGVGSHMESLILFTQYAWKHKTTLKKIKATYFFKVTNGRNAPGWWRTPLTPALVKQQQADSCEFKASLVKALRSCLKNETKQNCHTKEWLNVSKNIVSFSNFGLKKND